jgi:hypothetical protein
MNRIHQGSPSRVGSIMGLWGRYVGTESPHRVMRKPGGCLPETSARCLVRLAGLIGGLGWLVVAGGARPLLAQAAPDSGGFTVLHGADTVAVERFSLGVESLEGRLVLSAAGGARTSYHVTVLPADAGVPLIEISAWQGADPEQAPPRARTRFIFKDDSVAIDQIQRNGLDTRILPTAAGALPYLNLSFAFLELATGRARAAGGDSLAVPFFNLGGGQTVTGIVRAIGSDSARVLIGPVEFRLSVDSAGRILGGSIPAQNVRIVRQPGG